MAHMCQTSRNVQHLLLHRVVLLHVCLDLLHDRPVLNLGEGLGVTDCSSSGGGSCSLQAGPHIKKSALVNTCVKTQQVLDVTCWHETQSVLVVAPVVYALVATPVVAPVVAVVTPAEREAPPATPDPVPPLTLNTI